MKAKKLLALVTSFVMMAMLFPSYDIGADENSYNIFTEEKMEIDENNGETDLNESSSEENDIENDEETETTDSPNITEKEDINEASAEEDTADENDIAPMSLLPLEEVQAYLVLNKYSDEELQTLSIDNILDMLVDSDGQKIAIDKNATTVWRYCKSDIDGIEEYQKYSIGQNDTIDLSAASGIKAYDLELIVGSEHQLDSHNKRYVIKVYVTKTIEEKLEYELYSQDTNGKRTPVVPERKVNAVNTQLSQFGFTIEVNEYIVSAPAEGSQYYLGIKSLASEHPNVSVKVYDFESYIESYPSSDGDTDNLADRIMNQNMEFENAGINISYENVYLFVLEYYIDGDYANTNFVSFGAVSDSSYIDGSLYVKNNEQFNDVVLFNADAVELDDLGSALAGEGVHALCLMLKDGYSLDSDLYCILNAHGATYGDKANNYVIKAVKGHYNTLEDASSCEDIKDQLIPADQSSPSRGYKDNYDYRNGGVPFTIFFEDGSVWKLLVVAMEYNPKYDESYVRSFTDKPIIGEADPWLRVTGAEDSQGNTYDTYVIENGKTKNMDTYYGYGYQTLFINDANADLSRLKPIFWYANTDRIWAISKDTNSRVQNDHIRDFRNENQQYTGIIVDNEKENERNYWVTFKKINNRGPELFVFGPDEREVILDEYFEYKHDILIANIGNAPLEGLNVELLDAENVKLDSYWTVGGENNDTLAPFTATSSGTQYGEISNIAKIRLLPDGDGEVKGTLIIRAKDQEPVLITLNGTAQQPELITENISEGIKYVPYSDIVATNNIHDWNDVTFELYEGVLPEGIELNADTGELYGNPLETGEFKFTVEAKYTYFEPSFMELTLNVKDNLDDRVYEASDKGYEIEKILGVQSFDDADVNSDSDNTHHYVIDETVDEYLFASIGSFSEYNHNNSQNDGNRKVWLDGKLLTEGTDYDASEGSTHSNLYDKTINDLPDGRHTIAIEFREGGDRSNTLRKTSQNFYKKSSDVDPDPDPTPDPTPDPSPAPTPSPTPAPVRPNGNTSNTVNNTNNTTDSNQNDANSASLNITFTDSVGTPLTGYEIELHSKVQTAVVDKKGQVSFKNVEIGEHEIVVKNKNGDVVSTKDFTLKSANELILDNNLLKSESGVFALNYKVNIVIEDIKAGTGIYENVNAENSSSGTLMAIIITSFTAAAAFAIRRKIKKHY